MRKISVVGLGKIGLCMAALYASKGFEVTGIDKNTDTINAINDGKCPIYEPGLEQMLSLARAKKMLIASSRYEAVLNTEATFIMLPTPSDEMGKFQSKYVVEAVKSLAEVLAHKNRCHLVTVVSTLMPGTMDSEIAPLLAHLPHVQLCHSPVFVALGNVIKGLSQPDAVLIGESSKKAGDKLEGIFCELSGDVAIKKIPVVRMSMVNAELSKLLLNCFITTKIGIANACAEICEAVPGGDVDAVTSFLGLDKRIGAKCLKAGLGWGGTCFPRDGRALVALARDHKVKPLIQEAVNQHNCEHDTEVVVQAVKLAGGNGNHPTVAVLGLTYKTDVDLVDDSNALGIVERLCDLGLKVNAYDPLGIPKARKALTHSLLTYSPSVEECLANTDLCVVAVPWLDFGTIPPAGFKNTMRHPVLLDVWRMYDRQKFTKAGIEYHAVGVNDR